MNISGNEAFIFDIDGVLVSIDTHRIENPQILQFLIQLLLKNEPVALNTGRPLSWVKNAIINNIEKEIKDKSLLKNLIAVCEKGGVVLTFDTNGVEKIFIDKSININDDIKNAVRQMIATKFPNDVFYDEEKQTMVTVEKKEEITLKHFNEIHPLLDIEIKKILEKLDKESKINFIPTTIDTDIENNFVGKDFGVSKILAWLKSKGHSKDKFITFGDSLSDLAMAEHLSKEGYLVKFVFTGEKEIDINNYQFEIIITDQKYDKGTLEYLSKIN